MHLLSLVLEASLSVVQICCPLPRALLAGWGRRVSKIEDTHLVRSVLQVVCFILSTQTIHEMDGRDTLFLQYHDYILNY